MYRAHKIRLNPTPEQERYFRQACGIARFTYNWALARWKEQKAAGVKEYGPMALKKEFNAIRREQFPWTYDVSKSITATAFRDLGIALTNYYDSKSGKRKGTRVGFPKFKNKKEKRQSFYMESDRFTVNEYVLRIPAIGNVNMAEILRFDGKIMGARVVCESDGYWYISMAVELPDQKRSDNGKTVGVDLGIKTLATLSDGQRYENQVLLRSQMRKLKRLSRRLSRRKQGSQRWYKARVALGRFQACIANRRQDYLHKMTTEIAQSYSTVILEDLNVAGMVKNHRLALSLCDASFGEIGRQLGYKAQRLVKVGRFFPSSKLCECCGVVNDALTLADCTFVCPSCGHMEDRDLHASKNIEQQGLRLIAA